MEAGRPVDAVIAANRAVDITSSLVPHRRHQALEKPYLLLATAREAVRPWDLLRNSGLLRLDSMVGVSLHRPHLMHRRGALCELR